MPNKDQIYNRVHYLFDDPSDQLLYDNLFSLGNPKQERPFDINERGNLEKICYMNEDPVTHETSLVYPFKNADVDGEKVYSVEEYLRMHLHELQGKRLMILDPEKVIYPTEIKFNDDTKYTTMGAYLYEVPDKEKTSRMPKEPEGKPVKPHGFWYRVRQFFNTVTFGAAFKGVVEEDRQYDEALKAYQEKYQVYEKKLKDYNDFYALTRLAKKEWPNFDKEGVKIDKNLGRNDQIAIQNLDEVSKKLPMVEENLLGLLGPHVSERKNMAKMLKPVVNKIDQAKVGKLPKNFDDIDYAVFTHLALFSPEITKDNLHTAFKNVSKDDPLFDDRKVQLGGLAGHLQDIQYGRQDMSKFTGEKEYGNYLSKAHDIAGKAFSAWSKGNKKPLADLIVNNVSVLTGSVSRSITGVMSQYGMANVWETDKVYHAIDTIPGLKEAVTASGMTEETMDTLKANHEVLKQYEKSVEAYKMLEENDRLTKNDVRELVTEALMIEYMNGLIMEHATFLDQEVQKKRPQDQLDFQALEKYQMEVLKNHVLGDATEEYRALSDPKKLLEIRNEIKNSDYVNRLTDKYEISHDAFREEFIPTKRELKDPKYLEKVGYSIAASKKIKVSSRDQKEVEKKNEKVKIQEDLNKKKDAAMLK